MRWTDRPKMNTNVVLCLQGVQACNKIVILLNLIFQVDRFRPNTKASRQLHVFHRVFVLYHVPVPLSVQHVCHNCLECKLIQDLIKAAPTECQQVRVEAYLIYLLY